ncbi:MAG: hypothetical protein ISS15_09195 [Alphaproteobacteria bacterium]|nr:hypothetical protein [Alphaproteobacteria bacterium]MBL6938823.1 hypothetical protein [Alphaproteobacteria bacterium]MBL7097820.1 hypothetical protein [Alphaproteobacteria bacterium]
MKTRSLYAAAALVAFAVSPLANADSVSDKFRECRTGEGESAVAACTWYLNAGYNLSPQNKALALMLRAQAHLGLKQLLGALADYDAATQAQPRNPDAWYNHAVVASGMDKLEVAITDLDRVLELRPGWVPALVARGAVHIAHGEPQKAIADDTAALQLDPNNTQAQADLALARQRLGKP